MNGKRARMLRKFTAHMKNHGSTKYNHNINFKKSYRAFKKSYTQAPLNDYSIEKWMNVPESWTEEDKEKMTIVNGKVKFKQKKEGKLSTIKRINKLLAKIEGGKNEQNN